MHNKSNKNNKNSKLARVTKYVHRSTVSFKELKITTAVYTPVRIILDLDKRFGKHPLSKTMIRDATKCVSEALMVYWSKEPVRYNASYNHGTGHVLSMASKCIVKGTGYAICSIVAPSAVPTTMRVMNFISEPIGRAFAIIEESRQDNNPQAGYWTYAKNNYKNNYANWTLKALSSSLSKPAGSEIASHFILSDEGLNAMGFAEWSGKTLYELAGGSKWYKSMCEWIAPRLLSDLTMGRFIYITAANCGLEDYQISNTFLGGAIYDITLTIALATSARMATDIGDRLIQLAIRSQDHINRIHAERPLIRPEDYYSIADQEHTIRGDAEISPKGLVQIHITGDRYLDLAKLSVVLNKWTRHILCIDAGIKFVDLTTYVYQNLQDDWTLSEADSKIAQQKSLELAASANIITSNSTVDLVLLGTSVGVNVYYGNYWDAAWQITKYGVMVIGTSVLMVKAGVPAALALSVATIASAAASTTCHGYNLVYARLIDENSRTVCHEISDALSVNLLEKGYDFASETAYPYISDTLGTAYDYIFSKDSTPPPHNTGHWDSSHTDEELPSYHSDELQQYMQKYYELEYESEIIQQQYVDA